jgi:hypothetical protein
MNPTGVTPRGTPSTVTEHHPGLAVIESLPFPLCVREAATGSESTEMTGTAFEPVAAGAIDEGRGSATLPAAEALDL